MKPNLYVLPTANDRPICLEWAMMGNHPDDANLVRAVPVDDNTVFVGVADVPLERIAHRPMVARCDRGTWLPLSLFTPDRRVDTLDDEAYSLINRKLADMARGRLTYTESQLADQCDPEYDAHMADVTAMVEGTCE